MEIGHQWGQLSAMFGELGMVARRMVHRCPLGEPVSADTVTAAPEKEVDCETDSGCLAISEKD